MKELFMYIAESITRSLTGLEGSTFTLWEFETYVRTLEQVKQQLNTACLVALFVATVIAVIIMSNKLDDVDSEGEEA